MLLLLVTVFATSLLSGVVGMAGGIILMAVLVSLTTVENAMILHGITQMVANGSRFLILREHVQWSILPLYCLGASVAVIGFVVFTFVPDTNLVLILVGTGPLIANFIPSSRGLDITNPRTTVICGIVVTTAQLLAGASGPILDVFYQKSSLNRFQIVATKAITQTIGHISKSAYYLYALTALSNESLHPHATWIVLACVLIALLGTWLGTRVLKSIEERTFRRYVSWLITGVALFCVAKGGLGYFQAAFF